ncbi:MAG TPA: threonine ammonia-lyase [Acidimicrobiia bacterium]|nr:threonine ammonia-lyase [Acidimicrobiia bacterium]
MPDLVTLSEIHAAAERGKSVVMPTPLIPTHTFSVMSGRAVWLKAENLQRAGSFKIRGAMNALSLLDDDQRAAGVVAASAGNHAQGVALAATTLGIKSTVYMPENAALPKIDATRQYGADVKLHGENIGDALDAALVFAEETGARLIHPFDDRNIIAGQGTLGLELIDAMPEPGTVVVPVGGGGLISGIATAVKALSPSTRIVGVEAEATVPYIASRAAGKPTAVAPRFTVADGIAVARPSELCFHHIEAHVDDLVSVSDGQMMLAVTLLLERAKLMVEAAGAAALAALMAGLVPDRPGPTVLVLSGGNVDLLLVDQVIRHGLESAGRYGTFAVHVPDVPGQLARVTRSIADAGANVVSVDHQREGIGLPFGYTAIRFSVETRSEAQFESICRTLAGMGIEVLRSYET